MAPTTYIARHTGACRRRIFEEMMKDTGFANTFHEKDMHFADPDFPLQAATVTYSQTYLTALEPTQVFHCRQ